MLNKQNDKSSLTGLLLMAAILIIFNVFVFNNTEEQINNENSNSEKTTQNENSEESAILIDNQKETIIDSTEIITETEYILENDKVKLTFTNKGGEIKSAIVKGFYSYDEYKKNLDDNTYQSQDIEIFNNKDSKFEITADRNISSDVFFTVMESNNSITFRKDFDSDNFIEYIYTLNEASNFVDFTINTEGITNPELVWTIATPHTEKSKKNQEQYTGFYYQEEYSKEVDYTWDNDGFEINEYNTELSWIAFKQQFFTTIIEAKNNNFNRGTEFLVDVEEEESEYVKTLSLRTSLSDGENNYSIYLGPNNYNNLKSYDKGFEDVIPLGWGIFGWVNKYIIINIFKFLKDSAGMTSFGLIILILTLIIKFSLAPFTYKSYLSQAKMKVLKPEIDKINEKHKAKDPMKAQQETMGLYRKAGANPMGGCLPMLFQFPILIAMFRFFPASMDLRQNAFLWADDLSAFDSIYDLGFNIPMYGDHISLFTLLMTISTLMYTHMNSQMTSNQMPGMKWMMYLMPIMFLGFFNNYASALSYYYFLANIFTFSQMYFMRRFVDEDSILSQLEENKKKPKKKSKFQKKLEEMQKKQQDQIKGKKKK
jgi:YidC/Oxa1 family membrane protein insertase